MNLADHQIKALIWFIFGSLNLSLSIILAFAQ